MPGDIRILNFLVFTDCWWIIIVCGRKGKVIFNLTYRVLKLNKFDQLEHWTEIQLNNSKRNNDQLFSRLTPYFKNLVYIYDEKT